MTKSDLQARPGYHHPRDSNEAHLTIVLAALAISRWIGSRTGWSIRRFAQTARRYRTIEIRAGSRIIIITADVPRPGDLRGPSTASMDGQVHANVSQLGWAWLTQLTIAVGASTRLAAGRDPSTR
jgi:hypothetical protein